MKTVLDRVQRLSANRSLQKSLAQAQVWVEPLFAEGKDWHGMRRFRLRRLWRVNCEALMRAAGQNLKRLLKKRGWGRRPCPAEAVFAFFLAAFGWLTRLFSEYRSCSSPMSSDYSIRHEGMHFSLLMSFVESIFQQADLFCDMTANEKAILFIRHIKLESFFKG